MDGKGEKLMIEDKHKDIVNYLEQVIKIIEKMGIKIVDFSDRYVNLMLPKEPNVNHFGTVYAGSLFSLADFSAGVLFFASFDYKKYFPLLKEASIRYRRPATTNMTVELKLTPEQVAEARKAAEEKGKVDMVADLEIKDEHEEICCLVHLLWQIRKIDKK